ncbi:hypothetical protein ASE74_05860 [Pedobacter sp. Leaf216]|nr:hypothetical protein ASE74_05860 [Pedobacter sp. Leaf216]
MMACLERSTGEKSFKMHRNMFKDFSTTVEMTIRLVFIALSVISSEAQRSREIFYSCTNMFKDFSTTGEITILLVLDSPIVILAQAGILQLRQYLSIKIPNQPDSYRVGNDDLSLFPLFRAKHSAAEKSFKVAQICSRISPLRSK